MMDERRKDQRFLLDAFGLLLQDGLVSRVRIRDKNLTGIGALARQEFKPGQQGVVVTSWDHDRPAQEMPVEICWCLPDPMSEDEKFRYRLGLRILNATA